ncbi:hypothetical protein LZ30DRAFT_667291 [Colletotrichum cereale]|nr:hypothetical protein LZ30DRAFT_667291 [Colletotrichum cereale]
MPEFVTMFGRGIVYCGLPPRGLSTATIQRSEATAGRARDVVVLRWRDGPLALWNVPGRISLDLAEKWSVEAGPVIDQDTTAGLLQRFCTSGMTEGSPLQPACPKGGGGKGSMFGRQISGSLTVRRQLGSRSQMLGASGSMLTNLGTARRLMVYMSPGRRQVGLAKGRCASDCPPFLMELDQPQYYARMGPQSGHEILNEMNGQHHLLFGGPSLVVRHGINPLFVIHGSEETSVWEPNDFRRLHC